MDQKNAWTISKPKKTEGLQALSLLPLTTSVPKMHGTQECQVLDTLLDVAPDSIVFQMAWEDRRMAL